MNKLAGCVLLLLVIVASCNLALMTPDSGLVLPTRDDNPAASTSPRMLGMVLDSY